MPLYYYADALGNTVALTSGFFGNTPVERYTYDIFGAPTFRDGSGNIIASSAYDNRFLFTGREYLSELGLYDCRHRIYSPDFGRFLQPDPARFGGGDVNLYRYVHNSPMNLWDPLGLCCETEQATYDGAKQTLREAGKLGESAGKRAAEAESTFTMDAGRATVATGIAIGSGWNPVGLVAGGVAAFEWYSAYEDNKTFIEAEGDFKDAGDDIRDRSNELEAAREALADCLSEMGETPDNTDTYRR